MPALITWSLENNDIGYSELSASGLASNGENTSVTTIFLRHDSATDLTACKLYFVPKTGTYTGDATAADDFSELLAWGDDTDASDFGGIQVNFDAVGVWSGGATWDMSESVKTSPDGLKYTIRTGVGDSLANGISLPVEMSSSMTTLGELPAGVTDIRFQIRVKVPSSEGSTGTRQFSPVLSYTE
jgi:hypothetical protein